MNVKECFELLKYTFTAVGLYLALLAIMAAVVYAAGIVLRALL